MHNPANHWILELADYVTLDNSEFTRIYRNVAVPSVTASLIEFTGETAANSLYRCLGTITGICPSTGEWPRYHLTIKNSGHITYSTAICRDCAATLLAPYGL